MYIRVMSKVSTVTFGMAAVSWNVCTRSVQVVFEHMHPGIST